MKPNGLPYGVGDLVTDVECHTGPPRQVRCYVNGCGHLLRTPTRGDRGEVCPDHGIRCHCSSAGATYSYENSTRNVIASPAAFGQRIIGHPFKYASSPEFVGEFGFGEGSEVVIESGFVGFLSSETV